MTTANEAVADESVEKVVAVVTEEMKEEAKLAGVSRYWLIKNPDTLRKKIDAALEAKALDNAKDPTPEPVAPEVKRKPAPKMSVSGIRTNERSKMLKELEAKDPGAKYLLQPAGISGEALALKGLESTGKVWKNNVICRTDKEAYGEVMAEKRQKHRDVMDSIDSSQRLIQSFTESPKTGS